MNYEPIQKKRKELKDPIPIDPKTYEPILKKAKPKQKKSKETSSFEPMDYYYYFVMNAGKEITSITAYLKPKKQLSE